MDINQTKELDPMQLQVVVTPELGFGIGSLGAANRMSDEEAQEQATDIRNNYLVRVQTGTPAGCMDGREVVSTLDGQMLEHGYKTAGGSQITGTLAYEVQGYFEDEKTPFHGLARTINLIEDEGTTGVRFHISEGHKPTVEKTLISVREELREVHDIDEFIDRVMAMDLPSATGCGMDDECTGAAKNMARMPRTYKLADGSEYTETQEEADQRIDTIKATTKAINPEFSEETFDDQVDRPVADQFMRPRRKRIVHPPR